MEENKVTISTNEYRELITKTVIADVRGEIERIQTEAKAEVKAAQDRAEAEIAEAKKNEDYWWKSYSDTKAQLAKAEAELETYNKYFEANPVAKTEMNMYFTEQKDGEI